MNLFLILAATSSAIAAVLHLICIYKGASWYRLLGAGEDMAKMAEQGSFVPGVVTFGIFLVLSFWSLYAYVGAGIGRDLPYMRFVLSAITGIYLLRGVAGFLLVFYPMGRSAQFWVWSSTICLAMGLIHLIGLVQQLPQL